MEVKGSTCVLREDGLRTNEGRQGRKNEEMEQEVEMRGRRW